MSGQTMAAGSDSAPPQLHVCVLVVLCLKSGRQSFREGWQPCLTSKKTSPSVVWHLHSGYRECADLQRASHYRLTFKLAPRQYQISYPKEFCRSILEPQEQGSAKNPHVNVVEGKEN